MGKFLESIKTISLTINQWITLKYFTWISINAYLWYREYPVLDALIINAGIVLIHICVRVHSVLIGMMISSVNRDAMCEERTIQLFEPPNKEELN